MFVDHFIHSSFKKTESIRGAAREGLKTAKGRLIVSSGSFAILILCVFGRLIDISVLQRADESLVVESNFGYGLQMSRGEIIDRNGELLATNIVTGSLFANATDIQNPEKIAEKLVKIIPDASKSELVKRLSSQKTFIWLARHLTPAQQKKVMHLGIPGLHFKRDEKRIYPHGEVTAHLLGFTDVDNNELGEIERGFEAAENLLSDKGRLAIVTFHSLEDRLAKTFIHQRSRPPQTDRRNPYVASFQPIFKEISKKAIAPTAQEIKMNPRSRSAKLRVAERIRLQSTEGVGA